ncbi:MAG: tRNA pseudouridine(38-40) synthase TruA [Pelagibacteraceae bacterium]|nr:tRNA pseudouridine(38-40) synthase TruA [Pelagibacteraceae bacterium]
MRFKIIIEYDGTPFVGWQKQENGRSVQASIESAIEKLFDEKITIFGAGRTDAGVHAIGQTAHFDVSKKNFDTYIIKNALNDHLRPLPISILNVEKVNENFHSRFDAIQRKYLYRIINRKSPLTIEKGRAWQVHKTLNIDPMKDCIPLIVGKHDFTTFRSAHCQSDSPIKTIDEVKITQTDENIFFGISAKSFLHHQVRSIVGSLKMVGEGSWSINDFDIALKSKDRSKCGALAPSEGLYFMEVKY